MRVALVVGMVAATVACTDRPEPEVGSVASAALGPEFSTGGAATRIRDKGFQDESAIACADDGTCLVTYIDGSVVYGHRLDAASGAVLDLDGRAIATGVTRHANLNPTLAFGGGQYLAVWTRMDTGGNLDLVGIRLDAAGVPIDAAPFVIAATPAAELDADVTWGSGQFVVVWTRDLLSDGSTMDARSWGARIGATGAPSAPFELSPTTAYGALRPSVASDGTSFLATWSELVTDGTWDIRGRRFDAAGQAIGASFGVAVGDLNNDRDPDVAFAGSEYLVAWVDDPSGGTFKNVYVRRLAADGTAVGAARTPIATTSDPELEPVIATDGTSFLVAYQRDRTSVTRDVYGATVSAAGVAGTPFPIAAYADNQFEVDVAAGGGKYLVAFVDDHALSSYDVVAARVTSAGVVEDPSGVAIATSLHSEWSPLGCAGDTTSLFLWTEDRTDGVVRAYASRVDAAGQLLDAPIRLPSTGWLDYDTQCAWGSGMWFVVYRENLGLERVFGFRIAADGTVLDPTPIQLLNGSHADQPAVASDGTDFLVYLPTNGASWTRRVSASGVMSNLVAIGGSRLGPSQLSWNGSRYLLLTRYDMLEARLLEPSGAAATGALPIGPVPDTSFAVPYAEVASDGTDWLVFFQPVPTGAEIRARRIHGNGTMDPTIVIEAGPGMLRHDLHIAYDGQHYALAFNSYDQTAMAWSRRYLWTTRAGTPYAGAVLTEPSAYDALQSLNSHGNGSVLVAYNRARVGGASSAVHGRAITCDACVAPTVDAGVVDAGVIDAAVDAGVIDAMVADAMTVDAATDAMAVDASGAMIDAPSSPDAGVEPDEPRDEGCGCHTARPDPALALVGLFIVVSLRRRRRA